MDWSDIEKIMGVALATVIVQLWEDFKKWRAKKKEDEERPKRKTEDAKIRAEIKAKMVEIRMQANCNRVDLFEFGNGKMTHGNISLEFIYCTLEEVDNKSAGMSDRFQGIPADTMNKTLLEIDASQKGWLMFNDDSTDETANRRRKYWGIMSSYNFRITNSIWDGMIGLHFMHHYGKIEDNDIQEILRLIEDIRNLMAKLVKKEKMNIWQRLKTAFAIWAIMMIISGRDTIIPNYQKALSKPITYAIFRKDLEVYHEHKKLPYGK